MGMAADNVIEMNATSLLLQRCARSTYEKTYQFESSRPYFTQFSTFKFNSDIEIYLNMYGHIGDTSNVFVLNRMAFQRNDSS